jgi:DNA-binding NtrC family response regulator
MNRLTLVIADDFYINQNAITDPVNVSELRNVIERLVIEMCWKRFKTNVLQQTKYKINPIKIKIYLLSM